MRAPVVPVLVVLLTLVTGCTVGSAGASGKSGEVVTSAPEAALTLVADADPVASAVSVSRALFDRSTVVVVARNGDRAGTLLAASAAVGLGVPLLVEPAGGGTGDVVGAELHRLRTATVLAVGKAAAGATTSADGGPEVVTVPADAAAVEKATGLGLSDAEPVAPDDDLAAVAALDRGKPAALRPADGAGATSAPSGEVDGTVPEVDRGQPLA